MVRQPHGPIPEAHSLSQPTALSTPNVRIGKECFSMKTGTELFELPFEREREELPSSRGKHGDPLAIGIT